MRLGEIGMAAALLLASALQASADSAHGLNLMDVEQERDNFFQSADADGDFALSNDEQMSAFSQQHASLLECRDEDGDGLCTYSEFLASGQQVFDDLDRNGDGVLDADEIQ